MRGEKSRRRRISSDFGRFYSLAGPPWQKTGRFRLVFGHSWRQRRLWAASSRWHLIIDRPFISSPSSSRLALDMTNSLLIKNDKIAFGVCASESIHKSGKWKSFTRARAFVDRKWWLERELAWSSKWKLKCLHVFAYELNTAVAALHTAHREARQQRKK